MNSEEAEEIIKEQYYNIWGKIDSYVDYISQNEDVTDPWEIILGELTNLDKIDTHVLDYLYNGPDENTRDNWYSIRNGDVRELMKKAPHLVNIAIISVDKEDEKEREHIAQFLIVNELYDLLNDYPLKYDDIRFIRSEEMVDYLRKRGLHCKHCHVEYYKGDHVGHIFWMLTKPGKRFSVRKLNIFLKRVSWTSARKLKRLIRSFLKGYPHKSISEAIREDNKSWLVERIKDLHTTTSEKKDIMRYFAETFSSHEIYKILLKGIYIPDEEFTRDLVFIAIKHRLYANAFQLLRFVPLKVDKEMMNYAKEIGFEPIIELLYKYY